MMFTGDMSDLIKAVIIGGGLLLLLYGLGVFGGKGGKGGKGGNNNNSSTT